MTRYASQGGRRTIPLLSPSIGTEWWWVTKDTSRLHYPQQESRYPTGWSPGPVWTGFGEDKIFPHRDSNPEPPSPYRFSIPTTLTRPLLLQTYNRKNPSHFDPAIEWASQSAPHVKFVFLDRHNIGFKYWWKNSPKRAETSASPTPLQAHLQAAPVQELHRKMQHLWAVPTVK